jgi:hypothetical protein
MSKTTSYLLARKKAVFALLVTGVGDAVTVGLIPERYQPLALAVVGAANILGVHQLRNR